MKKFVAVVFCVIFGLVSLVVGETKQDIYIFAPPVGTSSYNIAVGIMDVVNRYSSTICVNVSGGFSSGKGIMTLIRRKDLRPRSIIFMASTDLFEAWAGIGRYKGMTSETMKFKGFMSVSLGVSTMITLDRNIKSFVDLANKRVVFAPDPSHTLYRIFAEIADFMGIRDTLRMEFMTQSAEIDALKGGRIDAGWIPVSKLGEFWSIPALFAELFSARDVYLVDIPKDAVISVKERTGFPIYAVTIPEGSFRSPSKTVSCFGRHILWVVHEDMPANIADELIRVIYDHFDEVRSYDYTLGKGMKREYMGLMGLGEDQVHPSIVRFYKSKGIKIGSMVGE